VSDAPLVSVILATNRNGPFLAETLASLQAQTYAAWELILVDDGSPDPDAVEASVAGIPGVVVIHQANAGVSVARNIGFSRSRGAYLAFLDDDDLWEPERLALQVAALEARPDAVAAFCQMTIIDEHGVATGSTALETGDFRAFIRNDAVAPIPTLLVTRWAIDRVGMFHPMLPPGEDLDMIYRLARVGAFVLVPEALVRYRRHGDNESGDLRGAALASRRALWVQRWWSTRLGEAEVLEDLQTGLRRSRQYWTDTMVRSAVHEARQGHLADAGRYVAFVARHDPVAGLRSLSQATRRKAAGRPDAPGRP
jgi:glycosyltransferase involved in cell wall biosynthesis